MDRLKLDATVYRTSEGIEDAGDLRAAIDEALATVPFNEQLLRDAVFTYVDTEREAHVQPGDVLAALVERVDARNRATGNHAEILRSVLRWSVEAYFGQLGGDALGADHSADVLNANR